MIVGLIAALFLLCAPLVWVAADARRNHGEKKADCALVLGAKVWPSGRTCTTLDYRLEAAAGLLREGRVKKLVVCGGRGGDEPCTEAFAMRRELLKMGVQEEDILCEDRSVNTRENLVNAKALMRSHGLNTALIVTSDYHVTRALWLARDESVPVVGGVPCRTPRGPYKRLKQLTREAVSRALYFLRKRGH